MSLKLKLKQLFLKPSHFYIHIHSHTLSLLTLTHTVQALLNKIYARSIYQNKSSRNSKQQEKSSNFSVHETTSWFPCLYFFIVAVSLLLFPLIKKYISLFYSFLFILFSMCWIWSCKISYTQYFSLKRKQCATGLICENNECLHKFYAPKL